MKLIFCIQINMKVSYIFQLWFLMKMVKHSQSFKSSKSAKSLKYLRWDIEVRDEVVFLHADKRQKFPTCDGVKIFYHLTMKLFNKTMKTFVNV